MAPLEFNLPWPPTMNTYWRSVIVTRRRRRVVQVLISAAGRTYRSEAIAAVLKQLRRPPRLAGRLRVEIVAMPPDRRVRDLDNLLKGSLDALTHAGVWTDDGALDRIEIARGAVTKGGSLHIRIHSLDQGSI